ncbi:MAG: hypothetical protein H0V34_08935 [Gammaproteobacteria bacterium]|nr:hypothetical protein [Gammaproteobacteria bacterium]
MGWADLDNLLDAMTEQFDVLVTGDKGIANQQHLSGRSFGLIVLRTETNRPPDLLPLVPALREALEMAKPSTVKEVAG